MAKNSFSYPTLKPIPEVVCGSGSLTSIKELVTTEATGESVFLLSTASAVQLALERVLKKRDIGIQDLTCLYKPHGEPNIAVIGEAVEFFIRHQPKYVCGIGGGAVLDWCKLALREARTREPALSETKLWLAPSTCGTGSEVGDVAIYTDSLGVKQPVVDKLMLADRVILDGSLLGTLLDNDWESASPFLADALSHAIEGTLSIVPLPIAKTIGLGGARTIVSMAVDRSANSSASKDRLLEASFLCGVTATNCSVGIAHAFAHSVARFGFGHGEANAWSLIASIRYNAGTPNFSIVLDTLGFQTIVALIDAVRRVVRSANQSSNASRMQSLLTQPDARRQIVKAMAKDSAIRTNPRRSSESDLNQFLDMVAQEIYACS